jgi:ABC-2 type transport system permease protein
VTTTTARTSTTTTSTTATRNTGPRLGGLNATLLGLELRRVLRNRRTLVFTLAMPAVFFLLFGVGADYAGEDAGRGNVSAFIMVSMAAYGAMIATTSSGAAVATERALGWSRQLRLTPLRPAAYVAVKIATAMVLGAIAVLVVYVLGALTSADLDGLGLWFSTAVLAWAGAVVFAAFGLFMGYLLPSENVMQVLGPVLAVLAFGGGLFMPLEEGSTLATIAEFTPMYGIAKIAHAPLTGDSLDLMWVVNVVVWATVFTVGAAWRLRRDTARV